MQLNIHDDPRSLKRYSKQNHQTKHLFSGYKATVFVPAVRKQFSEILNMSEYKIKRKHFDNPFEDYHAESAKELINGRKV